MPPLFLAIQIVHWESLESLRDSLGALHTASRFVNEDQVPANVEVRVYDDGSHPRLADEIEKIVRRERAFWRDRLHYTRSALRHGAYLAHLEMLQNGAPASFALLLSSSQRVSPDFFLKIQELENFSPERAALYVPACRRDSKVFAGARLNRSRARVESLELSSRQKRDAFWLQPLVLPVLPFLATNPAAIRSKGEEAASFELSLRLLGRGGWELELLKEWIVIDEASTSKGRSSRELVARWKLLPQVKQGLPLRFARWGLRAEAFVRGSWAWLRDDSEEAKAFWQVGSRNERSSG
jgi:hypothetical protein